MKLLKGCDSTNMTLEKKYRSLATYFSEATSQTIKLHFTEIESIMRRSLPSSAYLNYSWWVKVKASTRHYQAWTAAGYAVKYVQLNHYVVFEKIDEEIERGSFENPKAVLTIRPALYGDARSLTEFHKKTKKESKLLLDEKEEQEVTFEKVRKQIIECNHNNRSMILLAILNGKVVGYMKIKGDNSKRASHRAKVQLMIPADAPDTNISSALIKKSEEWAEEKGIKRFEVTILEENVQARKLFEHHLYEVEGIRKGSIWLENKLKNEVYMAKMFI